MTLKPEQITAVIDTREQCPLDLSPLNSVAGTLATGDREIQRLAAYPVPALVVESTWQAIERGEWRSQLKPAHVSRTIHVDMHERNPMPKQQPAIHYGPSPCKCGAYFTADSPRRTNDQAKVTCGSCRRRIALLELRPRSAFPAVPTFDVVADMPFDSGCGCHVVFRCPVCGRMNIHGRPGNQVGAGDGHRVAHCQCWPKGYVIHEVTQ